LAIANSWRLLRHSDGKLDVAVGDISAVESTDRRAAEKELLVNPCNTRQDISLPDRLRPTAAVRGLQPLEAFKVRDRVNRQTCRKIKLSISDQGGVRRCADLIGGIASDVLIANVQQHPDDVRAKSRPGCG